MNSKKLIKTEEKELNQILNEWDPIGILPFDGWPNNEYDCFIFPILSILHKDQGREKLESFIDEHLTEHMGMNSYEEDIKQISDKILLWWNSKNK